MIIPPPLVCHPHHTAPLLQPNHCCATSSTPMIIDPSWRVLSVLSAHCFGYHGVLHVWRATVLISLAAPAALRLSTALIMALLTGCAVFGYDRKIAKKKKLVRTGVTMHTEPPLLLGQLRQAVRATVRSLNYSCRSSILGLAGLCCGFHLAAGSQLQRPFCQIRPCR